MKSNGTPRRLTPLTLTKGNSPFQLSSETEGQSAREELAAKKETGETEQPVPVNPLAGQAEQSTQTPGSPNPEPEETSESSSVTNVPSPPSAKSFASPLVPPMASGQGQTKRTDKGGDK